MKFTTTIASVGMIAASLSAAPAFAHAKVESSEPKAGSELQSAPKEIRLHFSDTVEPAFSKIQVVDAANKALAVPKTTVEKDGKVMSAALPALPPGQYRVRWSTMTRDSHKVKGEYSFTVK